MTIKRIAVLAIAVRSGRMGYVFLLDDQVKDWALSRKAAKSTEVACSQLTAWVEKLAPEIVVLEDYKTIGRKSDMTRKIIKALTKRLKKSPAKMSLVERIQEYRNLYLEAQAYGERFPGMAHLVPKTRRLWEAEPGNAVYFEALALARLAGFFSDDL